MITISDSVGKAGRNRPMDVMIVQHLLNMNHRTTGLVSALYITGSLNLTAQYAIERFQRDVVKMAKPDGKISKGGGTLAKLAAAIEPTTTLGTLRSIIGANWSDGASRVGEAGSGLSLIRPADFLPLYDRQFTNLGASARSGLEALCNFINDDYDVLDVAWAAYMLATVKHECANTWQPIEEYGKGAGRTYGTAVTITDAAGKKHTNTYYGRGYVQLTWEGNYRTVGNAIGLGEDLVVNPSLALDPNTAYQIMSHGMRNGTFTGKKLSSYIGSSKCDYDNARRIINGMDQYQRITGYAVELEMLLRVSCTTKVDLSDW